MGSVTVFHLDSMKCPSMIYTGSVCPIATCDIWVTSSVGIGGMGDAVPENKGF